MSVQAFVALHHGDTSFDFGTLLPDRADATCPGCGVAVLCNETGVYEHLKDYPSCREAAALRACDVPGHDPECECGYRVGRDDRAGDDGTNLVSDPHGLRVDWEPRSDGSAFLSITRRR